MITARSTFVKLPVHDPAFIALPPDRAFAARLAPFAGGRLLPVTAHVFPDGETYLRFSGDAIDREVTIVGGLRDPDRHALPLLLLADAVRQWGAARVGLIAPYLPYMRQDAELHRGDAITARSFARILSRSFDWLVTVDPHLHRVHRLAEIYTIPARVVHAAPAVGKWIAANVQSPLVVGPDGESRQWAEDVAAVAKAPFVVLTKTRRGDDDVSIDIPLLDTFRGRHAVLVDDIISTGMTMAATVRHLIARGFDAPTCVGVHALFAPGAHEALTEAGAGVVATTNSVPHATNRIDIAPLLAGAVSRRGKTLR